MTPEEPTPYDLIGGEEGVRRLVDRFYDLMDELDEVTALRDMHAKSLKVSREKLFMFMSGWLGGPALYVEKYGHPMLRGRHMPFAIDQEARDQWMLCMSRALEETVEDEDLRRYIDVSIGRVADHMRNQF
ncbi:group II truncated hemoglobin [Persicimonas caeni]|uniref:Group II truncated hemoglobin n=1 Tax=Persicimonas caeni TaxID=2292766 RepID=A0A4Y6PNV2_PERCE|nr:group II truncated hemoglobin [Persicimonas caeni]QDG49485.1 group II truncated hemoglobin [Persicimonas caeni]QED30706.1 group II truncated hemoglobin [Persicimonas caeni]